MKAEQEGKPLCAGLRPHLPYMQELSDVTQETLTGLFLCPFSPVSFALELAKPTLQFIAEIRGVYNVTGARKEMEMSITLDASHVWSVVPAPASRPS